MIVVPLKSQCESSPQTFYLDVMEKITSFKIELAGIGSFVMYCNNGMSHSKYVEQFELKGRFLKGADQIQLTSTSKSQFRTCIKQYNRLVTVSAQTTLFTLREFA